MNQLTLTIIPNTDIIFPYQPIRLVIGPNSPFYGKTLMGKTLGMCFYDDIGGNTDSDSRFRSLGVSFTVESEQIETNPKKAESCKIITGTAHARFRILKFLSSTTFPLTAEVETLVETEPMIEKKVDLGDEVASSLKSLMSSYINMLGKNEIMMVPNQEIPMDAGLPSLHYAAASCLEVPNEIKYSLLEIDDFDTRIGKVIQTLKGELEHMNVSDELMKEISAVKEKKLRKKKLEEERDGILKQLYGSTQDQTDVLFSYLKSCNLPEGTRQAVKADFVRLENMDPRSKDYPIEKKYLETVSQLPWNTTTEEVNNLSYATEILDQNHYGLGKVKTRILEFLAVKMLNKSSKGSILCLQGPPGVGKTSLGKSIADSLGRKFARVALGGVNDEAEIRGHRRTYVGAMPGVFIENLIKCKSKNPVILLDEIDKMGRSNGDPSAALLEVLDPNQNHAFKDRYLGVPFDLSEVLFVATSNNLENIPAPLLDRLEVLDLNGYSREEKVDIAMKHLVPKQIKEHGLREDQIQFTSSSIRFLIDNYTKEAGVRNIERLIGAICRKVSYAYLKTTQTLENMQEESLVLEEYSHCETVVVTESMIEKELGPRVYDRSNRQSITESGMALGLTRTPEGGQVLIVETSKCKGKGNLQITGQAGNVMQESIVTALSWIVGSDLANQQKKALLEKLDIHVHFPEAAMAKDGSSNGVAITVALVSLLSNRKVKNDVAMAGEVSLKGVVLPIEGVKERCMAAYSEGITRVILPEKNKHDIEEIPKEVRQNMTFSFVKHVAEAVVLALEPRTEAAESERSMRIIRNTKL